MARMEQHVRRVRNRLALAKVVHALGWGALGVAGVALGGVLVDRWMQFGLGSPANWIALGIVAGAGVILSVAWGLYRRPNAVAAAAAMDEKLGTKDRFATALYFQLSSDEFAQAARKDAERAAENVTLRKQFPLTFPRPAYGALALAALAVACALWLPPMDLLGHQKRTQQQAQRQQQVASAKQAVKQALAKVQSVPKAAADKQVLEKAQHDLEALLKQPEPDPAAAHRKALEALQNVDQSMKEKIQNSAQFAQLQQQRDMLKALEPGSDSENAALKEARQAMKKGDFAQAAQAMQKAAEQFQTMTPQQKQAMAQQMQAMANQLQQAANNLAQTQQMQQQLQQMGATAQQAQQMTNLLQQAAQGNSAAQQQLQQMAQQLAQQASGSSGSAQMQQQLQQALQQMQGQMAANQQAQQLAQAAAQMAQAMQQNSKQRMASAGESMQQQMGQLAALQQDMQQMQAMQQSMQQAAGQQMAAANGQGQKNGAPGGQGAGTGGSRAGTGHAVAPLPDDSIKAVYKTHAEQAPSDTNAKSPVLASFFIKAPTIKGKSEIKMSELQQATAQEAAESVDQQHVPPPVREAVKEYFDFSK